MTFGRIYLEALQEVEVALVQEKYQKRLLARLSNELAIAQDTLRESRSRYINGLNDYLRVIVALQESATIRA